MNRTIRTCAGIGDSIFLIKKLINAKEKFNILLPDGKPQRGHQIWELIPQLNESVNYVSGMTYKSIEGYSQHRKGWSNITAPEFYLSANKWLEDGNRNEDYLPELPTSHHIKWAMDKPEWKAEINSEFPIRKTKKYIGIYTSAYSTSRQWGFWGWEQWYELIQLIHKERPKWHFILMGAEWDNDILEDLDGALSSQFIEGKELYHSTVISKPLGYVSQIMKRLDYGFYFPSGLPILSETIKGASDLTMFFPPHLEQMMGTFCDPARKESGQLKECLFCSPTDIYHWWRDEYQGFERLEQTKGVL